MDERTDEERARERLQDLGKVIRQFRGDLTQTELGERLGEAQTTLSRWEAGLVDLGVNQVRALEDALRVPHGTLGRAAGFISDEVIDAESDGFRFGIFDRLDDALLELLAADALGIGVRVFNRWSEPDEDDVRSMEWIVVLLIDPREVA